MIKWYVYIIRTFILYYQNIVYDVFYLSVSLVIWSIQIAATSLIASCKTGIKWKYLFILQLSSIVFRNSYHIRVLALQRKEVASYWRYNYRSKYPHNACSDAEKRYIIFVKMYEDKWWYVSMPMLVSRGHGFKLFDYLIECIRYIYIFISIIS